MPIYEYNCECGHTYDELKNIEDRMNAICPECGEIPQLKVANLIAFDSGVLRENGKDMTGEYNVGLGETVFSKSDMKRKAKAKGLHWIGDDPIPKEKPKPEAKVDWDAVAYDLDKAGVKN